MKRKILLVCFVLAIIGFALPASALEIGVRGYYWLPAVSGDIQVDKYIELGTTIDMTSDLKYEDESYPVVEVFAGLGNHHFSVSTYNAAYEGSGTLSKTITFDGQDFTEGTSISSKFEYQVYDFMYQYYLLDLENMLAGFSIGFVLRVKALEGDISVNDSKRDFTVPMPMVGLNLHAGILAGILEARVLATGFSFSTDQADGSMVDAQADISFTPFPFIDIHGGYRTFFTNLDTEEVRFNYNTSGPYVAVTVSF